MTEAISGHCPQCKGRRRAFVKAEYVTEWFDDHDRMSGKLRYYILECGGGEDIFFKRELTSDDDEDERWSQKDNAYVRFSNVHEMFWPKPQIRSKPDWVTYHHLKDRELVQVLEEVYKALNEQMPVLAAMGMRIVFDRTAVMLGLNAADPFAKKLKDLQVRGFIGITERDGLEALIEAGSAAAHRAWQPNSAQLHTLIERLETFIHGVFVLHPDVLKLKTEIPVKTSKALPAPDPHTTAKK